MRTANSSLTSAVLYKSSFLPRYKFYLIPTVRLFFLFEQKLEISRQIKIIIPIIRIKLNVYQCKAYNVFYKRKNTHYIIYMPYLLNGDVKENGSFQTLVGHWSMADFGTK